MTIVVLEREPRYFLRPGPGDRNLLDRLLSPDFFSDPVELEGLVLDAPRIAAYGEVRDKLPGAAAVLVDPQAYRLQKDSCADHPSLKKLGYYPDNGCFRPEAFQSKEFTKQFVTSVLDEQQAIRPTSYVAPSFFVDSPDSPWSDVNERLLNETLAQAGPKVFAALCGSYSVFCRSSTPNPQMQAILARGIEGVLVLISPIKAIGDNPTKLTNYLHFLQSLGESGIEVIACRQPAFGLGCLAVGASGFDSGIGTTEQFDFAALTRPVKKPADDSKTRGGARRRMIYLPQLLTSVPYAVAEAIFSTSGVSGSFVCNEPCCRDHVKGALLNPRDHFVYTRLKEVRELKQRLPEWREQHFNQSLLASRQMSEKVLRAFPDTPLPAFQHLDVWSRVIAGASVMRQGVK